MSHPEVAALTIRSSQYRDYPEDLKASVIAAIEANNGNVMATARLFNLPRDTVNYWWYHSERYVEIKQGKALSLADKLESLANDTADSLLVHDFSIVAARDKATVMGIAIEKMQLLRGQPTEIVENVESHKVLVLMAGALGVEEKAINVTSVPCGTGESEPQEQIAEVSTESTRCDSLIFRTE